MNSVNLYCNDSFKDLKQKRSYMKEATAFSLALVFVIASLCSGSNGTANPLPDDIGSSGAFGY